MLNSLPVSASATFAISAGKLQITLNDLEANPTSDIQTISDLQFSLNSSVLGPSSGYTSSAQHLTVTSNTSFSTGATASTGWGFGTTGTASYVLCIICGNGITFYQGQSGQPADTIIGPPSSLTHNYSAANPSITGGTHNPFLNQTATFTITDAGITNSTIISNVVFSFGTTPGSNVTGVFVAPEPSAILLTALGFGALALAFVRRRKAEPVQSKL